MFVRYAREGNKGQRSGTWTICTGSLDELIPPVLIPGQDSTDSSSSLSSGAAWVVTSQSVWRLAAWIMDEPCRPVSVEGIYVDWIALPFKTSPVCIRGLVWIWKRLHTQKIKRPGNLQSIQMEPPVSMKLFPLLQTAAISWAERHQERSVGHEGPPDEHLVSIGPLGHVTESTDLWTVVYDPENVLKLRWRSLWDVKATVSWGFEFSVVLLEWKCSAAEEKMFPAKTNNTSEDDERLLDYLKQHMR